MGLATIDAMKREFKSAYAELNDDQRKAVDQVEGPVMVIAGPGTGKTQLLSMRVANILRLTDANPGNILCLTFTDNAARNMRERLKEIIGQSAYHVSIHTFHSFGNEVIGQYPDHFSSRLLMQQVDELGRFELAKEIFDGLEHSNPLSTKVGEDDYIFLKDTLSIIGWLKQNALSPVELHEIINANKRFMESVEDELINAFAVPTSPKQLPVYTKLLASLKEHDGEALFGFPGYGNVCANELAAAIDASPKEGRFAPPMTAWRNTWCSRDSAGRTVFKDAGRALRKLHALANVYEQLIKSMEDKGLYDFDDMVVEVVHALERDDELRYSLQERYQYILVDEFQDTNKAQMRLLEALGNNPVNMDKPNVMVVGDDDQAIYAFQGADVSNMAAFASRYSIKKPIVLSDNYRSTKKIVSASSQISGQLTDRLVDILPELSQRRLISRAEYKLSDIGHLAFPSELAQYDWVAEKIEECLKNGIRPESIAVLAPQHRYLERLMPYFGERHIPVAYERRENILEAPIILQLLAMTELITALMDNDQESADSMFGEVLAYDFFNIPAEVIVDISLKCYDQHEHWLKVLTDKSSDKAVREVASWFTELAKNARTEPLEYILDRLIGGLGEDSNDSDELPGKRSTKSFVSPMREYYFAQDNYENATDEYLMLLGQLTTLRHRLREWKPFQTLFVRDLVEFTKLHKAANLKIVDTNPHTRTTDAVQVMTAYKAKGLEFDAVFVINAQDEVWGPTARSRGLMVSLPKNLPIAPSRSSDNDRLRLLYVALTRARHSLYLTSYTHDLNNRLSPALSFIEADNGEDKTKDVFKPSTIDKPASVRSISILSTDWAYRFRQIIADKPTLFEPLLADYKLSVTHLNNFLDVAGGGPSYFLLHNLLRFPKAPTPSAAYGDCIHKTLQRAHIELVRNGKLPNIKSIQGYFTELLRLKHLKKSDYNRLEKRGLKALEQYFNKRSNRFSVKDLLERGFNNEGVVVGEATLSGKIDKLMFTEPGQVKVIDFKTGKPAESWDGHDEYERLKLHKYRQQLLFYKILVENSASFKGKVIVSCGELEFIEADEREHLLDNLELSFEDKEMERFTRLIAAVWSHIAGLNFPDVSRDYEPTFKGVSRFEQDLIDGKI